MERNVATFATAAECSLRELTTHARAWSSEHCRFVAGRFKRRGRRT